MPDQFGNPTLEEIRQYRLPQPIPAPRQLSDAEKSQLLFSERPGASRLQKRVGKRISLDEALRNKRFDQNIRASQHSIQVEGVRADAVKGLELKEKNRAAAEQERIAGVQYVNGDLVMGGGGSLGAPLAQERWENARKAALRVHGKVNKQGEVSQRNKNINYKLAYIHDALLASEENRSIGLPQALGGSGSGIFDQGITEEMFVKEAKRQGFGGGQGSDDDIFLTTWFRMAQSKAYGKKMDTAGSGYVHGFVGPGHKWSGKATAGNMATVGLGGGVKIPAYGSKAKTEGHIPEGHWNQPGAIPYTGGMLRETVAGEGFSGPVRPLDLIVKPTRRNVWSNRAGRARLRANVPNPEGYAR